MAGHFVTGEAYQYLSDNRFTRGVIEGMEDRVVDAAGAYGRRIAPRGFKNTGEGWAGDYASGGLDYIIDGDRGDLDRLPRYALDDPSKIQGRAPEMADAIRRARHRAGPREEDEDDARYRRYLASEGVQMALRHKFGR